MKDWLAKFLADEERTGVWSHCEADGFPTWAYFRGRAAIQRYRQACGIIEPLHAPNTLRQHLQGLLAAHLRSLLILPWTQRADFDAVFFTNVNLANNPFGGEQPVDRIHESFFQSCGKPLILESAYGGRFIRYQPWRRNVFCATTWTVFVRRLFECAAWARSSRPGDAAVAVSLAEMFQGQLPLQDLLRGIRRMRGAMQFYAYWVRRVLSPRMARRVAFVTSACALGQNALLTHVLRRQGYLVLEAQHGVINENVFSYQFPHVEDPETLTRVLPDVLLTFGPAVNAAVAPSIRCRVVGNSFMCQVAQQAQRQPPQHAVQDNAILVISQGGASRKMAQITEALAHALPDKRIILKLHPSEQPDADALAQAKTCPNVRITLRENVYTLMAQAPLIVGYFSLALLEAAVLPGKRIFMLKNAYLPRGLGYEFTDAADLVAAIRDPHCGIPTLRVEDYWSPDPQQQSAALFREILPR